VYETNPRAIRAYEKAGFVLEGRQRQAEIKNGKYIDVLVMSLLREEYLVSKE
jgi:RimJ/RimL family protein N-acetyltransferase